MSRTNRSKIALADERGMVLAVSMIFLAAVVILVMAAVAFGYYSMQYSFYRQQYITAMMRSEQAVNRGFWYLTISSTSAPPMVTIPVQPTPTALKNYVINTASGTVENNYKIVYDDQQHLYGVGYAGANNTYKRVVQVNVSVTQLGTPPSAVYIDTPHVNSSFAGNAFKISGYDTLPDGSSGGHPALDGVSTSNSTATEEFKDGLTKTQKDNITGATPIKPDVVTTTTTVDVNSLFTALSGAADYRLSGTVNGGTWGTSSAPAITYWSTDADIGGTFVGAGALVVNGSMHIRGTFLWEGLVITKGDIITEAGGNPAIYGALLVKDPGTTYFTIKGNIDIYYDQAALEMFRRLYAFQKGSWVELK